MNKQKKPPELWLAEAVSTVNKLPSAMIKQKLTLWPEQKQVKKKGFGQKKVRSWGANPPSAEAITRLDIVLDCLISVSEEERRVLWARAKNMSWDRMEYLEKSSRAVLLQRHADALEKFASALGKY